MSKRPYKCVSGQEYQHISNKRMLLIPQNDE